MNSRSDVPARKKRLCLEFQRYLVAYDEHTPFSYEQLKIHQSVINKRRVLGSAMDAMTNDEFLEDLHELLSKWGMAERGAKLVNIESFKTNIQSLCLDISSLEAFTIMNPEPIFSSKVIPEVVRIIQRLNINENRSKVVAGSKALHHLLPDLIPPIDRAYTGRFFAWHRRYFQDRQPQILKEGLLFFNRLAREVQPQFFRGSRWRTSQTKILDNAVVGYCILENLSHPS